MPWTSFDILLRRSAGLGPPGARCTGPRSCQRAPPLCAFTAGNLAVDALPTVKNAIVAQKGLALETALQPLAALPLSRAPDSGA